MASTNYAIRANAPTTILQATATATATSTASAIQVSTLGVRFLMTATEPFFVKFGTSASMTAPTTANSLYIPADSPHVFDRTPEVTHAKVLREGGTSAKVTFGKVA